MKVLIIDNYDSFTYNLAQAVEQCDVSGLEIVKSDKLNIKDVENFHKILISPGPGLPKDYPNLFRILEIYSASKSILGVCLGHQAIAEYFGATLINLDCIYHGTTKFVQVFVKEDYLFRDIPDGFEGGLYHSWAVSGVDFPRELEITSVANDGMIMSLSHKTFDVKGIQFHPESIMTEVGYKIIRNWLKN